MPNTLTSIFVSNPATEPVEAPHPNTGVYVTGTQATLGGPWTVVHTLITKTTTPLTMVGRLKNFPAVTVSVVASGGPNAGNIFNNILAMPTGTAATATSSTALNVAVSSIANQTAYRLLAANTAAGPFAQIYQGSTASYSHSGLTAGQTQFYQWQYVGGGFYDDSPASAVFQGTASAASTAAAITSFTPASAAAGAVVTLTGTNLSGAANLRFNGVLATITGNTATSITTTVPASATTGAITVTCTAGTATTSTLFTVTAAAASGLPIQVIAFGNSQTAGYLATGVASTIGSYSDGAWPDQFAALAGSGYVVRNKGANGNDWAALQSRVTADLGPLYQPANYSRQVVIVQEFTNTAWHDSQTGNASNQGAAAVAQSIRALGFTEVWIFTGYPFLQTSDGTLTTNVNTLLDQANSVLLDSSGTNTASAYASFNKIMNIRTSAAFANSTAAVDTAVFVDGVHCTNYGNQTPAHLLLDAFASASKVVNSTFTYPTSNPGGILGTAEALLRTDPRVQGTNNMTDNAGGFYYTNNFGVPATVNFTLGVKFVMGTQFTGGTAIISIDGTQQTGPLAGGAYSLVAGTVFEYHPNQGGHTFSIHLQSGSPQYLIIDSNTFTIWHT